MSDLSISSIFFEHHRAALGIAETKPRISWRFEGDVVDWEQSAYDIQISRASSRGAAISTFSFNSSDSLYVPWPDEPLLETEAAGIRVRSHGEGASTPWSDWVGVETGLLTDQGWGEAHPITADVCKTSYEVTKRPVYFRNDFVIPEATTVASARLYITALGIYEAEINGKRVGDLVLAPGWQSYNHRHVYDTYNVTQMVSNGKNAIGVVVGEGWYVGRIGLGGYVRNIYGDSIGLQALLVVTLEDGTEIKLPTDTSWKANKGPIVSSQIYDGETYDASLRAEIQGWSTTAFRGKDKLWHGTRTLPRLKGKLTPPDQPGMRKMEELRPQRIFESPSGKTLIDFGQNFVGWLRINVDGPAGTNITLHHAEVLDGGELALRPLRAAKATDTILLSGDGPLTWEPKFTFHGFRYAQVDGWPKDVIDADAITGVVVHTDMEQTGWFHSSHDLLNRFHSNVRWSMKGNFLSIPMDCPQRDERLGWTGDAHVFGPTSNYLYDTAGFWRGWHRDIWSEMSANGNMVPPYYTPDIPLYGTSDIPTAVWGDVVVGNPWNIYKSFGDKGLLEEHLPQARGWLDNGIPRNNARLWDRSQFQFGDWLDPLSPSDAPGNATTHPVLVADAYLVRMTEIMANISEALGTSHLLDKYSREHAALRKEFIHAWTREGVMANNTQTAYALAIAFNILTNDTERRNATATLRALVENNDYLVGTGFAGTPALSQALRMSNATEDFYRMLLQTKVPSWLYQVEMGGTTTWERWDSMLPDGRINPGEMTSFNHYAFGSVAQFVHEVIGGIAPAEPGYKRVAIAPVPGGGITHAEARYISPYGEVATKWSVDGGGFHLEVKVPPNSKADVTLPGTGKAVTVGSGTHRFDQVGYRLP